MNIITPPLQKISKFGLINILIKHGAAPLKDKAGRTPLMCLGFSPFNTGYNCQIIELYIDFEAAFYHLDPKEYREKFFKLREGGFLLGKTSWAAVFQFQLNQ